MSVTHCVFCFDVLAAKLLDGRDDDNHVSPGFPDEKMPLFVTWNLVKNGRESLRGCIGNFEPLPLHKGLKEYAIISALKDRRFNPISTKELPNLTCAVSLLVNFEKADNHFDWEIGLHGIWIEFRDENGRKRTATYLPEVMEEQGWNKIEAIDSLLKKGGYLSKITEECRQTIVLTRYQSKKHTITYDEYLEFIQGQ
ncbi:AMME syndrome candidate protein 1 protein [Nowakowskiella sp. JEL0078]|nr:AMME syndrome candidate protein 1 protein [Nowakowskiella sp. JEL0078]